MSKLNKKQFNQLFNLYYEELCRIVYPVLNNKTDAEDVVQDVFVSFWSNRNKTIIKTNHKAYLYKACVFKAIDLIRKQKSKHKASEYLQLVGNDSTTKEEDDLHAKELETIISKSINKLSDTTKEIFLLSRYSNLKNREIAEQLNISIKTVEANISKALKLLKEDLKPHLNNLIIAFILTQEMFHQIMIG